MVDIKDYIFQSVGWYQCKHRHAYICMLIHTKLGPQKVRGEHSYVAMSDSQGENITLFARIENKEEKE